MRRSTSTAGVPPCSTGDKIIFIEKKCKHDTIQTHQFVARSVDDSCRPAGFGPEPGGDRYGIRRSGSRCRRHRDCQGFIGRHDDRCERLLPDRGSGYGCRTGIFVRGVRDARAPRRKQDARRREVRPDVGRGRGAGGGRLRRTAQVAPDRRHHEIQSAGCHRRPLVGHHDRPAGTSVGCDDPEHHLRGGCGSRDPRARQRRPQFGRLAAGCRRQLRHGGRTAADQSAGHRLDRGAEGCLVGRHLRIACGERCHHHHDQGGLGHAAPLQRLGLHGLQGAL